MQSEHESILIVDDEKNIRLTLTHALESQGYATATAANGEDALKKCEMQDFDLVLLDLRMPGLDGTEVLRQIAERWPHTRVVIVTAHGTIENAVEALKLGAVDFIQKPFTPQEIRELVTRVLNREHLGEKRAGEKCAPEENRAGENRVTDYATLLELAKHAINERRFADAMAELGQAIAADSSRPEAFNLLGVLHEMGKDHHQAVVNYRIALDLDPTYEPARQNLSRSSGLPGSRPRKFDLE